MNSEALSLTCAYAPCGTQFEATRRRKYCTPLCERRAYTARRRADGRLAESRKKRAGKIAEYQRANADKWRVERTCCVCGKAWRTQRKDAVYCSFTCRDVSKLGDAEATQHTRTRRAMARRKATIAARGTSGGVWVMGCCIRCDSPFVCRARGGRSAQYCGRGCYQKDKASTRRVRLRGVERETVRRVRVFERDEWTCHLCGEPLSREASFPDPLYPTLDHVMPIAKGGSHTMANVKAAHFICNSSKSDQLLWPTAA